MEEINMLEDMEFVYNEDDFEFDFVEDILFGIVLLFIFDE